MFSMKNGAVFTAPFFIFPECTKKKTYKRRQLQNYRPTVFTARRDGFIAQTQHAHHASLSLSVLACGVLAVWR